MLDVSYAPQVPANGRRTSKEPNQHPEPDDRDRLLPREELGMNQPAVNERVGAVGERDRRQPAEHPFERALEEKRASHEAVGRAHQAHDGDLAAALQHRHPNRRADDDDGDDRERRAYHEPTAAAIWRSRSTFATQSRPNRTSSTKPKPRSRSATSFTCSTSRKRGLSFTSIEAGRGLRSSSCSTSRNSTSSARARSSA